MKKIGDYEFATEYQSNCCGAPVYGGTCSDCKDQADAEEIADQDEVCDALKELANAIKEKDARISEARRNLRELEEEREALDHTENEISNLVIE